MELPYRDKIEKELDEFFNNKKNKDVFSSDVLGAIDILTEYTMRGGKRIRAILMIVGYLACEGNKLYEIIRVSTSLELLQSFFLVHDDIMDEDDLRRGGDTVHAYYNKKYNQRNSESLAIAIGDMAFCYTLEPILESNFDEKLKLRAIKELAKISKETCYGQIMDIFGSINEVDEEYINKIQINKTAKYTISGPLRLGAILAGADEKMIDSFNEFGLNLGRSFQIKDDILGVFGDEKKLGKPVGSDLIEGKKTLLILQSNSDYVNGRIGKKLTDEEINNIRNIIIDSGSLKYSEDLAHELINKAKENLEGININSKQKDFLLSLVDYLGKREK